MSSDTFPEDLAEFSAQVTDALMRAMDARARGAGRIGKLPDFTVTTGVVMTTPPGDFLTVQDGLDRTARGNGSAAARTAERLATGTEFGRESLARLNDDLSEDPHATLDLLSAVVDDPTLWGVLFEVSERQWRELRNPDPAALKGLESIVRRIRAFGDDLVSVSLEIDRPKSGKGGQRSGTARASGSPWLPDKFELGGEVGTDGKGKVTAKLTWEF